MRERRRWVWWLLVVAFVSTPIIEIWTIIQVGQVIGAWWTIALLIADSVLGSWLIRHEGGRAWQALQTALRSGQMPAREIADGALILMGGTLMLSPGFVTDIFGIIMILPVTRPLARVLLARAIERRLLLHGNDNRPGSTGSGPVIRGDVIE